MFATPLDTQDRSNRQTAIELRLENRLRASLRSTEIIRMLGLNMKKIMTRLLVLYTALFTLSVQAEDPTFSRQLSLQDITFAIESSNLGSINNLSIKTEGLEIANERISIEIEGSVYEAELADLNNDGSPEVYIYITGPGSGSYGNLIAFSANNKKSLSAIYLVDLFDNPELSEGYMGHDRFTIMENVLARRFPIYRDGDANHSPTGGVRQIRYTLKAGEAGWILDFKDKVDYQP